MPKKKKRGVDISGARHPFCRLNALDDSPLICAARQGNMQAVTSFVDQLRLEATDPKSYDIGLSSFKVSFYILNLRNSEQV